MIMVQSLLHVDWSALQEKSDEDLPSLAGLKGKLVDVSASIRIDATGDMAQENQVDMVENVQDSIERGAYVDLGLLKCLIQPQQTSKGGSVYIETYILY